MAPFSMISEDAVSTRNARGSIRLFVTVRDFNALIQSMTAHVNLRALAVAVDIRGFVQLNEVCTCASTLGFRMRKDLNLLGSNARGARRVCRA
jgi:hypothetical protein